MEEIREDPGEQAALYLLNHALDASIISRGEDMMPIFLALVELVKILQMQKPQVDKTEKIDRLSRHSELAQRLREVKENTPDYIHAELWALIEGMNKFTETVDQKSTQHSFQNLSEWIKAILDNFFALDDRDEAGLGEFSKYGRDHPNIVLVQDFYRTMHRSDEAETLDRLCNGIEIYSLLKNLHKLSEKEVDPEEVKALYKTFMMALHKAGKLTTALKQELSREAQDCAFDSLGHIYGIFREMLKDDKASALLDYAPKKEVLDPTESFVRVLERNTAPQAVGNMLFAHQQQMAEARLHTLMRAGAGIGLFVALSNLEKVRTESRETDEHYPDAKLKADRSNQIETVYSELILALKVAGLLTESLNEALVREMSDCLNSVEKDPHAELTFKFVARCHADLKNMLRKDTVCILADYVPKDKDLYLSDEAFDPQKPFYQFLVEDYFNKGNVGQATVLNQSALELDKYYRQKLSEGLQADYGNLLGDKGQLNSESLNKVLANFDPVKKLEILDEIFKSILENKYSMYEPPKKFFGVKSPYTPLQLNHIKVLQEKFLDILRNNKNPLLADCIGPSKLLAFKDAGLVGLKAQAREIVQKQTASVLSKK